MTKLTVALRNFANGPKNSEGPRHTCLVLHNPDMFGSARHCEIFTELFLSANCTVAVSELPSVCEPANTILHTNVFTSL